MARIAVLVSLGLSLLAGWATAADTPQIASVLGLAEGLPSIRGWARCDLVLGRLRVSCGRTAGQSSCSVEHPEGIVESYTLQVVGGIASTQYSAVGPRDQLSAVIAGSDARLSYERDEAPQLLLEQHAEGPLVLTHYVAGKPRKLRRATLLTLLRLHRRDWQIEQVLADSLNAMTHPAGDPGEIPTKQELERLLHGLGAGTYAARRKAQARLNATGQAAYPFLASLDPATLDAEKRAARRELLDRLARAGEDSPERIALWLNGETNVWHALAERGTPGRQSVARRRFGGPLETAVAPKSLR